MPAIVEYIPYRKTDATAAGDAEMHPYFAGFGYASIRIDMRGSGDSDGILYDEYLKQEQDDALEALRWIAAQPWCTGKVGIIGISWGGFNGLQIAARQPPELGAVITSARPTTATTTMSTTSAAACCRRACSWGAVCSPTTRARRTPRASATAGARCGSSA